MKKASLGFLLLTAMYLPAQDTAAISIPVGPVKARLLAPLSTQFSRKGDMVAAQVVEPAQIKGAILEGELREVKAAEAAGKSSVMQFEMHALHMSSKAIPITAAFAEIRNSQGRAGEDEAGHVLEAGGGAISNIGSAITGVFSRGGGPIRLTAKASALSFAPGSEIVLQIQRRGK